MDSIFKQQELLEFWRSVIDPNCIGMPEAIAKDISSYTNEPIDLVLQKMETGKEDLKRLWDTLCINKSDPNCVEMFYKYQFIEAYDLANWHCGRENGIPPLNYAYAAKFAQRKNLNRVLDFGSGIGTGSMCLASIGCEVHAADIAQELLSFLGYRLEQKHFPVNLINLSRGDKPQIHYYDLITCFDVLEHIPDQLSKLRELESYLCNGGYLLVNFLNNSTDYERPMHISSAGNWLSIVRRTNMYPEWSSCFGSTQSLRRARHARFRNTLALWIEYIKIL